MGAIWIKKTLKLNQIKGYFLESLRLSPASLQFYDQDDNLASSDVILRKIATKSPKTVEFKISAQMSLEDIKTYFEENYGVKTDIVNPDGSSFANEATLDDVRKIWGNNPGSGTSVMAKLAEKKAKTGDKIQARKIYTRILDIAEDVFTLIRIAESVASVEYLNDKDWARKIYKQAFDKAEGALGLIKIAESIVNKKNLGDKDWARKVYKKASEMAKDLSVKKNLAESISNEQNLGDEDWARGIYNQTLGKTKDMNNIENDIIGHFSAKLPVSVSVRNLCLGVQKETGTFQMNTGNKVDGYMHFEGEATYVFTWELPKFKDNFLRGLKDAWEPNVDFLNYELPFYTDDLDVEEDSGSHGTAYNLEHIEIGEYEYESMDYDGEVEGEHLWAVHTAFHNVTIVFENDEELYFQADTKDIREGNRLFLPNELFFKEDMEEIKDRWGIRRSYGSVYQVTRKEAINIIEEIIDRQ